MTEQEWEELYYCLYAFTDKLVKSKKWFRGPMTHSSVKGKQVHDYVVDGIERYLTAPEKHNPDKGALADYIKYNIIRTLVHNDSISAENRTSWDVFGVDTDEEDGDLSYLDAILPYAAALFDQQLDYDLVMGFVEGEVKSDEVVENIFLGVTSGMKRSEIMEEFGLSASEYGNGIRRLGTILKRAVDKFDLQQSVS